MLSDQDLAAIPLAPTPRLAPTSMLSIDRLVFGCRSLIAFFRRKSLPAPSNLTLSWHRFFATLIKKSTTLLMEYAVVSVFILGTSRVIRYYQCLGSYDEYTQLAILHHFCGADIQKQLCFVTTHRDSEMVLPREIQENLVKNASLC